jgi:hypothetical protein
MSLLFEIMAGPFRLLFSLWEKCTQKMYKAPIKYTKTIQNTVAQPESAGQFQP